MARLLIADVTVRKSDGRVIAEVLFRGGATRTLSIALPRRMYEVRRTPREVRDEIDRLLDDHTDGEVATILNKRGYTSGEGKRFHNIRVSVIRRQYALRSRYQRLRERGMLLLQEIADHFGIEPSTAKIWRRAGLLAAHRVDDRGSFLFEKPGGNSPVKHARKLQKSQQRTNNPQTH